MNFDSQVSIEQEEIISEALTSCLSGRNVLYDDLVSNRLLSDSFFGPNLEMLKRTAMLFSAPHDTSDILSSSFSSEESKIYNWENKTILIAEDEETNFLYLKAALRKTNAKLLHAWNGKEAVELMEQKEKEIDIVLMDIKMPEMNGIEATKHIKTMNKNKVVIAQTAYVMEDDRSAYAKAGCDEFLAKPISRDKLIITLSKYLDR